MRVVLLAVCSLAAPVVRSAAVGVTVPRLAEDAGATAWPGGLGVALGAGAALWSAWRLLRAVRRPWWVVALPALLVAAYAVLWTVGQGVAASYPAHPADGSRTPSDVGLRFEPATVPTADGADLAAWWVPSGNGAAVVLLHGAGSTRTAVLDQAAVLGSHGYGVLLLDARGHGDSGGRGMDLGWYGEHDVAAALDFLAIRPEVAADRVGVVGLSMGGEEAIGAAGEVDTERLAAQRLQEAAPDVVEVWTVPGAGHTQGLRTRPDAWERRVVGFLDEALAP